VGSNEAPVLERWCQALGGGRLAPHWERVRCHGAKVEWHVTKWGAGVFSGHEESGGGRLQICFAPPRAIICLIVGVDCIREGDIRKLRIRPLDKVKRCTIVARPYLNNQGRR